MYLGDAAVQAALLGSRRSALALAFFSIHLVTKAGVKAAMEDGTPRNQRAIL